MNQVFLAFLTGLTSGGISCLAVQGGFLTSAITNKANGEIKDWKIVLSFLLAKLLIYTLLGIVLGIVGSAFRISPFVISSSLIWATAEGCGPSTLSQSPRPTEPRF